VRVYTQVLTPANRAQDNASMGEMEDAMRDIVRVMEPEPTHHHERRSRGGRQAAHSAAAEEPDAADASCHEMCGADHAPATANEDGV